jgi:hypothetical protein
MKHKVLSAKQPWAYLICSGIKDIENRTWKCPQKYIGERVLIHAGAQWDGRHRNMAHLFTIKQWGALSPSMQVVMAHGNLPTSAIIGSVRFVDCVVNHPSVWAEKTPYFHIGNLTVECQKPIHNWVLANPILFDKPILNVKGKLGFWDYDLSEEYETILKL